MSTTLNYLLPFLRLRLGDTDATAYRYLDEWLLSSLWLAIRNLQRWQDSKYLIDDLGNVTRNSLSTRFTTDEAVEGVIEKQDEYLIILFATYLTLEGSLENSAWDFGSWKDAEISYSNIEGGRVRTDMLKRLWEEITSLLLPPTKRLAGAIKNSLPGYIDNTNERTSRF